MNKMQVYVPFIELATVATDSQEKLGTEPHILCVDIKSVKESNAK